jgi:pSer/pThr/pTyr-binding forkhead associated (FHA) protein
MKIGLVVVKGRPEGMEIPLPVPQFLIGRDPHCNLRPSSEAVSKLHCAILHKKDGVYVRDMKSTNGTFINNDRIFGEIKVKDGDLLRIGPLVLAFKIEVGPAVSGSATPGTDDDKAVSWLLDYSAGTGAADPADIGSKTAILDVSGGTGATKPAAEQKELEEADTKVDGETAKPPEKPKHRIGATPEVAGDLLEKLLAPPRRKKT